MRLILLFSALLAALTGVGASACAANVPQMEQRASAAAEAAVAVVARVGSPARSAPGATRHRGFQPQHVYAADELFQDRPLE